MKDQPWTLSLDKDHLSIFLFPTIYIVNNTHCVLNISIKSNSPVLDSNSVITIKAAQSNWSVVIHHRPVNAVTPDTISPSNLEYFIDRNCFLHLLSPPSDILDETSSDAYFNFLSQWRISGPGLCRPAQDRDHCRASHHILAEMPIWVCHFRRSTPATHRTPSRLRL